jgi:hypothetical protein
VSDAVGLPIYIQSTPHTPVSGALARRLGQECEHVRYFKVETQPLADEVGRALAEAGEVWLISQDV